MKLCYRGVRYEKNSMSAPAPTPEIMGKYRGVPCKLHEDRPPLLQRLKTHLKLKYRGTDYQAV
ncbi:DUF4278 domain-containing protein [Oscillatoriales cyanobacterium LEGE 11467]|uniref:DUF4278 domain-containing protein n=1 Tax=Zarconia navalis LEGE 11467 TaxID=1828826 RepID=A0A928W048_9CYAN|nr:DUF4278 domain-containing protein [Zarconia navalis]MBE9041428.1 DUF4278 domain-containing protein [Zarconia navalis LEGE 11467]